jgi:predicted acylesterase/phospholipase RssA
LIHGVDLKPADDEDWFSMDDHSIATLAPPGPATRTGFALIMKGGGMKGIAYIGALQELERFYRFDMYAGTSAGAITAALLGAGYTVDELRKIMFETDFSTFIPERLSQFTNFLFYGGLHRGLELTLWLDRLLASKLDSVNQVVLGQLPIPVVLYACRRDADAIIFDSADRKSTPVSYAVRCSMSIPLFFTPEKSEGLNVFDGGMRHNYPVQALLKRYPGKKFIGLYLGEEVYIPRRPSVFRDLINIAFEATDVESVNEHKNSTIIIDPSPVSTVDFKLSREEKEFLLSQGRAAARKFLKARRLISDDEYNEVKAAAAEAKKRAVEIRRRRSRRKTARKIGLFLIGFGLAAMLAWTLLSPSPPVLGTFVSHYWSSLSPPDRSTKWAGVSAADDNFQQMIFLIGQPALAGASTGDQLGPVAGVPGDKGGVFFWGNVNKDSTGKFDPNNSRLHIEIWDNKSMRFGPTGNRQKPLSLHIGPEQEGFIGVELGDNVITFKSTFMRISLAGDLQAEPFTGSMYFSNAYTKEEWHLLGDFIVPRNGFFNY